MSLVLDEVSKYWGGDVCGVKDVSMEFGKGVTGLLGPNGAGKSTLMQMITTLTKPTEGTIEWHGKDVVKNPEALRSDLGYLPQDFGVYPDLTAEGFLQYVAALKGLDRAIIDDRIDHLLRVTNLENARDRKLNNYSGGMRQRVGIAQALLDDPDLLVVDEPTVGLDPEKRVRFRNLIANLSEEQIVLLSTHIVSDVEATATDLVIMNDGQMITHMPPEDLISKAKDNVWEWTVDRSKIDSIKKDNTVTQISARNEGIRIRAVSDSQPHSKAVSVEPSLEDAYLSLIEGQNTEGVHPNPL